MKLMTCALAVALAGPAADPCAEISPETPQSGDTQLTFQNRDSCEHHCISLAVGKDGLVNEEARLEDEKVATDHGCDKSGTLCLTPRGEPVDPKKVPKRLRPGDQLTVKVIGCEALQDGVSFEIDTQYTASADRLFRTVPAAAVSKDDQRATIQPGQCVKDRLCLETASIVVLHETTIDVPRDESLQRIDVTFESNVTKATYKNLEPSKDSFSIPIIQGRYFIDLGILVPFVFDGQRRIVTEQGPGAGTRILAIDQDMPKPAPAVMLDVFPGGRRSGIFQSFGEGSHARNAANSLGFQAGLDLDFTDPADAFYLGALFEPITGLSFNAGVSIRKGQFLGPGRRVGQLVADDLDVEPQTRYMARPYVGVTFSLDIIRALIAFRGRARSIDTNAD